MVVEWCDAQRDESWNSHRRRVRSEKVGFLQQQNDKYILIISILICHKCHSLEKFRTYKWRFANIVPWLHFEMMRLLYHCQNRNKSDLDSRLKKFQKCCKHLLTLILSLTIDLGNSVRSVFRIEDANDEYDQHMYWCTRWQKSPKHNIPMVFESTRKNGILISTFHCCWTCNN